MNIYFDLETAPNPDMVKYLPEVEAPSNYKDPAKIGEYILRTHEEQISKMALDPDLGQITTFAYSDGNNYRVIYIGDKLPKGNSVENKLIVAVPKKSEFELVTEAWEALYSFETMIGYNILSFDFPYLMRRSLANKITPPFIPNLAKYHTNGNIIDLYAILYNWDKGKGLKKVRDMYGLQNISPEINDITGASVNEQPLELRLKYAINDVFLCVQLYETMMGIYFR